MMLDRLFSEKPNDPLDEPAGFAFEPASVNPVFFIDRSPSFLSSRDYLQALYAE